MGNLNIGLNVKLKEQIETILTERGISTETLEYKLRAAEDEVESRPELDGAPTAVCADARARALNEVLNRLWAELNVLEPDAEDQEEAIEPDAEDQEEAIEPDAEGQEEAIEPDAEGQEEPATAEGQEEPATAEGVIYCTQNPLIENCAECPVFKECMDSYLKFRVQIPWFIIDYYLPILSKPATKILLYLARKTNFAENGKHSKNFGRVWSSHADIEKGTGVKRSNFSRYLSELEGHGLITRTTTRHTQEGRVVSVNQYTIPWFKVVRDLRTKVKERRAETS